MNLFEGKPAELKGQSVVLVIMNHSNVCSTNKSSVSQL